MVELDKKDVAIPAQYMKTAVEIMRHGDNSVPDYMIWLQRGDFTGCPRVTFIYGSDETLYRKRVNRCIPWPSHNI